MSGVLRIRLLNFTYLQLLDLLTTVAFLLQGVQEGNPLVRFAMGAANSPVLGLVAVKMAAMGLGAYCWWNRKDRLLGRINVLFALLVAWNLFALIVASSSR